MNRVKRLSAVLTAMVCAFSVCSCAGPNVRLVLFDIDDNISVHTELQSAYLSSTYDSISNYATGKAELSRPQSVYFTWSDINAKGYTLEVSDNKQFISPTVYNTELTYVDVYNLKTGTEYFWRVTAKLSDGNKVKSDVSVFFTEESAPRNMYVDGVTNVRDLGGWKTVNGTTVKQGMIIRCGRLNKSQTAEPQIEITADGIRTMRDVLGVRTEIDLRMPDKYGPETGGITESPLGADINYVNIPMDWAKDANNFNYLSEEDYYPAIKQFFAVAADEKNYPIIFHCNIGTDRTGLYAFLINGLLGVSEDDLYRDYLFSNFGNIGGSRSVNNIKSYVAKAKSFDGETLSEQIANCLTDGVGVPRDHINKVISIMKGD